MRKALQILREALHILFRAEEGREVCVCGGGTRFSCACLSRGKR